MRRSRHKPPSSLISVKERRWLVALSVSLVVCLSAVYGVYSNPRMFDAMLGKANAMVVEPGGDGFLDGDERDPPAHNPLELRQIDRCTQVNRELLNEVQDDTRARREETPALFQLLCVASTTSPRALAESSRHDVSLGALFRQPNHFRGQLIHIQGTLARLERVEAVQDANDFGIREYYEAWIFPEGQNRVACIVTFTQLPDGLTPALEMKEAVSIDAFFFKWFVYRNKDDVPRRAAHLVGGQLHWKPPVESVQDWTEALILGGMFLALIAGATTWMLVRSRRDANTAGEIRERAIEPIAPVAPVFSDEPLSPESPPINPKPSPPEPPPPPDEWLPNQ